MAFGFCSATFAQYSEKDQAPEIQDIHYRATAIPDRIILTWGKNDMTTQTVTWRTDTTVAEGRADLTKVARAVDFYKTKTKFKAKTTVAKAIDETAHYHTVTFDNLSPGTMYAYRVGGNDIWSEWVEFSTPETTFSQAFEFIYLGDAQNDLFPLWSRIVRAAYAQAPQSRFIMHAGDLINHAENNYEWGEWFEAGSFIFKQIPQLAVAGNHEYIKNEAGKKTDITSLWNPQFNFPGNGIEGLEDSNYYIDYLNCRIIALNSNEKIDEQAPWLEKVLSENDKPWVIVMFHHPVISAARGRVNEGVLNHWKPILDKYKVDLVLQGHDHVYGRGNQVNSGKGQWNENSGSVYVVSLAGRKTYELSEHPWMQKSLENAQLYQIIRVEDQKIVYKAYTADRQLFDAFEIKKQKGKNNRLIELMAD